jgi:hypothetical protein
VTALGVLSIIFSLWMGLMSLGTGAQVGVFAWLRSMPGPTVPAGTLPAVPSTLPQARAQELAGWIAQNARLDPAQQAMLATLLESHGAHLIVNHAAVISAQDVAIEVTPVGGGVIGSIELATSTGTIDVQSTSVSISIVDGSRKTTHSIDSTGSRTTMVVINGTPQTFRPFVQTGMTPLILLAADGLLSLCAAVVLMVAGIRTLQSRRSGRRWHVIWVWIKIPLAIFGAVAVGLLTESMMSSVIASTPAPQPPFSLGMLAVVQALLQGATAMIYPVAVLIVLNLKSVRAWYAQYARA